MILRFIVPLLLICLQAPPTGAPDVFQNPIEVATASKEFSTVNELLRGANPMRASFIEEKHLKALKRPLKSSGKLVLHSERGLYRNTTEPRSSELVLSNVGITQRDSEGRVERIDATKQPIVKSFVDAFLLVLSGDTRGLEAHFRIYFSGSIESWTLGLAPKKEPLSKVIASIVVEGSKDRVQRYVIREVSGDCTVVTWTEVSNKAPLTEDEARRWFDWAKP